MKSVVDQVRRGEGPVFVEAVTMRLGPHAGVGDNHECRPSSSRPQGSLAGAAHARLLLEAGIPAPKTAGKIEEAAAPRSSSAIAKASASKVTPQEETLIDVFADRAAAAAPRPLSEARGGGRPSGETKTDAHAGSESAMRAEIALEQDKGVFLLGEDIGDPPGGVFATSKGLQTKFGKERVRPTPIAEQSIIGAGIGAALVGMRPVAEIMFNDFAGVCLDQIFNHAAKQRYMSGSASHMSR
jgi:hypothetical protein